MRKPYIIYSPPYTKLSAGIKALHMLCDALKNAGEHVEMRLMGWQHAPLPSDAIAIYPEIVSGNPLNAQHIVRWLLYYAGVYRGNKRFPKADMVWGYTKRIAKDYGVDEVLFLPTVDETEFRVPQTPVVRRGTCFYAHKYKTFYHGDLLPITQGAVEITNPGQSREEIVALLQTSEVFYAYEDTALIMEAVLCGCPVVCLPNPYFRECCGLEDFNAGIAWGMAEFPKALESVNWAHLQYKVLKEKFFKDQLPTFIERTQADNAT